MKQRITIEVTHERDEEFIAGETVRRMHTVQGVTHVEVIPQPVGTISQEPAIQQAAVYIRALADRIFNGDRNHHNAQLLELAATVLDERAQARGTCTPATTQYLHDSRAQAAVDTLVSLGYVHHIGGRLWTQPLTRSDLLELAATLDTTHAITKPATLWRVGPYESIADIAVKWGCKPEEIIKLNDIAPPNFIKVGQTLRLPPKAI